MGVKDGSVEFFERSGHLRALVVLMGIAVSS